MTTLSIKLTSICAGGNHLTFGITGDKTATIPMMLSDLTDPITEADAIAFCRVLANMAKNGRTLQQAKTLLQSGVQVTV